MSFFQIFYPHFFSPHQSRELGISRIFAVNTKNCFIAVSIEDSINPIQNRCNPDRESFLTTEARTPPCPSVDTSISAVNPNKSVLVSLYVSQWPSTIILKIVLPSRYHDHEKKSLLKVITYFACSCVMLIQA